MIVNESLLNKENKYIIGISGGPDSMALAYYLIKKEYKLIFCHINYHHRDEANDEEAMVKAFACQYNIPIYVFDAYFDNNGNFEDWARVFRYQKFHEVGVKQDIDNVIVAHHQDDLIETYLMQLKRGYVSYFGLNECSKIKNMNVLRLLLASSKKDIMDYVIENKLPYSIDVTNFDTKLTRNKIRSEIINQISDEQRNKLIQEINQKNYQLNKLNLEISEFLNSGFLIDKFKNFSHEKQIRTLYQFIQGSCSNISLNTSRLQDLTNRIIFQQGNFELELEKDIFLFKEYNCLKIVKNKLYNYYVTVDTPSIVDNEFVYFDLCSSPEKLFIKKDDYPLIITNCLGNEVVKIGKIHKTFSRIMIDEKIPLEKRKYWPKIISSDGRIIFIPRESRSKTCLFLVKDLK